MSAAHGKKDGSLFHDVVGRRGIDPREDTARNVWLTPLRVRLGRRGIDPREDTASHMFMHQLVKLISRRGIDPREDTASECV